MRYLVKFRPLEPYTFGTDQTFNFPSGDKTGKESYFVLSNRMPAQTTVLGALRYLVLQRRELLHTDFHYGTVKKEEITAVIGPESFRFDGGKDQRFGVIDCVSPLFLLRQSEDKKEHILIRNPFHNRAQNSGWQPMRLTKGTVLTSHGGIRLPDAKEYEEYKAKAKDGYARGYIDITDGAKTIYPEEKIFRSVTLPGNQKSSGADERAYYQRETIRLHEDFRFAVYVDAEADAFPPDSVVYMGQKRAAFRVTAEPFKEDAAGTAAETLETQVREAFADDTEEVWFYALSPLWFPLSPVFRSFCIVEETSQRNLTTNYTAARHIQKLKRTPVRYHLAQTGSVFYGERPQGWDVEHCRKIGYNSIVQLGGKERV